jgi:mannan polymerase II complex ANP1 subunit
MEREKLAQEQAEKEKAEKVMKLKESFSDATGQWEKDKSELQKITLQEKKKEAAADAEAAVAKNNAGSKAARDKTEEKAAASKRRQGAWQDLMATATGRWCSEMTLCILFRFYFPYFVFLV